MNCRRHGRKPTIALWMLVAVADVVALTAATGVVAMLVILTALVAVAGGVMAARPLLRRSAAPTEVVARRRA
jgi:hypothetical protein